MRIIEKFRKLAQELNNNSNIILKQYEEYYPISNEDIVEIENKIGFEIPKAIKEFYQETNGLHLSWIHKKDESYVAKDHQAFMDFPTELNDKVFKNPIDFLAPFYEPESNHESACISIKSLRDIFTEPFDFDGAEELVNNGIYVFDGFSSIKGAAIYFTKSMEPRIVLCSDYYIDFEIENQEMTMSFDEYLELLIESKGIKCFRTEKKEVIKLKKLLSDSLENWPSDFYYSEF